MSSNIGEIFEENLRTFLQPITPFWDDPSISTIFINQPNEIWVERSHGLEKIPTRLSMEHIEHAVLEIAQFFGVMLNDDHPELHTNLPNGIGISIVTPPVARSGPVITLRKPSSASFSLDELIQTDFLNESSAAFLKGALASRLSVLIVGPPSCGKSTLLRALAEQIPHNERMVLIEQRRELEIQHPHLICFEANADISVQRLLLSAASLRPDRLILGDLRGNEALDLVRLLNAAFQGSATTLNAYDSFNALHRLESFCFHHQANLPLSSLRAFISNAFQIVIVCQHFPNGKRCISSIHELLPTDKNGNYQLSTLFELMPSSLFESGDNPELSNLLLPCGVLPRNWNRLQQYGFYHLNSAFFNPQNYDEEGDRSPNANTPLSTTKSNKEKQISDLMDLLNPLLAQHANTPSPNTPPNMPPRAELPRKTTPPELSFAEQLNAMSKENLAKDPPREDISEPVRQARQSSHTMEPTNNPLDFVSTPLTEESNPFYEPPVELFEELDDEELIEELIEELDPEELIEEPELWENEETFAKSKGVRWEHPPEAQPGVFSRQLTTPKPSPARRNQEILGTPDILLEEDMLRLQNELQQAAPISYDPLDDDVEPPTMAGVPAASWKKTQSSLQAIQEETPPPHNVPRERTPDGTPPSKSPNETPPPMGLNPAGQQIPNPHKPERSVVVRRGNRQPQNELPIFALEDGEQTSIRSRPVRPNSQTGAPTAPPDSATVARESPSLPPPASRRKMPSEPHPHQRQQIQSDLPPSQPTVIRGRRPSSKK